MFTFPSGAPATSVLAAERNSPAIELLKESMTKQIKSAVDGAVTKEQNTALRTERTKCLVEKLVMAYPLTPG